jgi:hypothetical protein
MPLKPREFGLQCERLVGQVTSVRNVSAKGP